MKKLILTLTIIFISLVAFSQRDTVYTFDGNKTATNITQGWENNEYITTVNVENNNITIKNDIKKSDIHYIFKNGEYHQITKVSQAEYDIKNIQLHQKYSKRGWTAVTIGTGMVLGSMIYNDIQIKNALNNNTTPNNIPKYLNYTGFGLIAIGGIINITSFKYLDKSIIDITPVGVRVKL